MYRGEIMLVEAIWAHLTSRTRRIHDLRRIVSSGKSTSSLYWLLWGPFCQTTRLPSLAQERDQGESSTKPSGEAPPPYSILSPIPRHTPPPAPKPRHATLSFSEEQSSSILPPPAYDAATSFQSRDERPPTPPYHPGEDVVHYLASEDSFQSISLVYGVPAHILKAHNGIHSDNLLSARRKIKIPASHYQGPSLSPNPLENPEEQEKKSKIRRLMVKCKVAEYKLAVMYLEDADWNFETAEAKINEDDRWERAHPLSGQGSVSSTSDNSYTRRLRLAEPLSTKRIARLLSWDLFTTGALVHRQLTSFWDQHLSELACLDPTWHVHCILLPNKCNVNVLSALWYMCNILHSRCFDVRHTSTSQRSENIDQKQLNPHAGVCT